MREHAPEHQTARQAAQRDSLWILDIGSSNHDGHTSPMAICPHKAQAILIVDAKVQ